MIEPQSFLGFPARTRLPGEIGNAYPLPNGERRGGQLGVYQESFDCKPAGGQRHDPVDSLNPLEKRPPCFVAPKQLYNDKQFIKPERGDARVVPPPQGDQGNAPADPNRR